MFFLTRQQISMTYRQVWDGKNFCCNLTLDGHCQRSTAETASTSDHFSPITSWLHKEKTGFDLNLDQELAQQLQLLKDEQDRICKANRQWDHQLKNTTSVYENALHYMDTIKLHAPNFDCHIDGVCDGPAATYQDIPSGPTLQTEHDNADYQLPLLLSDRPTPVSGYIPPIPFHHILIQSQNKTKTETISEVHHGTGSAGLDWQMEEEWGNKCHIAPPTDPKSMGAPQELKPDYQCRQTWSWQFYIKVCRHTGHKRQ